MKAFFRKLFCKHKYIVESCNYTHGPNYNDPACYMEYLKQCKKCSTYMNYHMTYNFGNPFSYYTCPCCGYDTRNDDSYYTVSNHTTITDQNVSASTSTFMRDASKEEKESVNKYVEDISKKSGVNFYDLIDSDSDDLEEDDNYDEYQNKYDAAIRFTLIVMLRRLYDTAFNLLSSEHWNMFKKEAYNISYYRQFDEKETDESSVSIHETKEESTKDEVLNSKYDPDMPCNKKKCDAKTRQSCCGCPEQLEYEKKLKQQNKK